MDLKSGGHNAFSAEPVNQLNRILGVVEDLYIIISSTWRVLHSLSWLRDHFESQGFLYADKIIGITPDLRYEKVRGEEIAAWLSEHPGVTQYVILDDDRDMAHLISNLLQTEFHTGLTAEIADEIIKRLK